MACAFMKIVVLSLSIHGCLGYDASMSFFQKFCNDAENCADYQLGQRLKDIDYLPTTEQELNAFCPSITKLMWCVVQECAGKNVFCSNSPSNRGGNSMISALNIGSIVLEICTYGSELRQNYLYDISCVKGIMFRNGKSNNKCLFEGHSVMLSSQLSVEGVSEEDRKKDMVCISIARIMWCAAKSIFLWTPPRNSIDNFVNSGFNLEKVICEICTFGSRLRQNYLAGISCFKDLLFDERTYNNCLVYGRQTIHRLNLSIEGASDEEKELDRMCMSTFNGLACLVVETENVCGTVTSNMVNEIFQKIKLLTLLNCNEDNMQDLALNFLESKSVDRKKAKIYISFFDS
ncbi:unnamed protein product [Larinioides sclopetarius]|uniref:Uncharacterized protein n=1 Tax=Larinioides sclopetarius TaxID=280406 RepID=A0AAV1ZEY9_9ARAC